MPSLTKKFRIKIQNSRIDIEIRGQLMKKIFISTRNQQTDSEKTLKSSAINTEVKIKHLRYSEEKKILLYEMGVSEGESIRRIYRSPFGSPSIYEVCGYQLALRDDITENIVVQ